MFPSAILKLRHPRAFLLPKTCFIDFISRRLNKQSLSLQKTKQRSQSMVWLKKNISREQKQTKILQRFMISDIFVPIVHFLQNKFKTTFEPDFLATKIFGKIRHFSFYLKIQLQIVNTLILYISTC